MAPQNRYFVIPESEHILIGFNQLWASSILNLLVNQFAIVLVVFATYKDHIIHLHNLYLESRHWIKFNLLSPVLLYSIANGTYSLSLFLVDLSLSLSIQIRKVNVAVGSPLWRQAVQKPTKSEAVRAMSTVRNTQSQSCWFVVYFAENTRTITKRVLWQELKTVVRMFQYG